MANAPTKPKSLQIVSWNVNGLRKSKLEIEEILERYNVDVMALQETKLRREIELKFPGYQVYRRDRDARGGGVALLVKRTIDHHPIVTPELENIEATAIVVSTARNGELTVVSCYQPPRNALLSRDLEALFPGGAQVVAIGDFNAKSQEWNSRLTNTRGREMLRFLGTHQNILAMGPEEPTYHHVRNRPDVLDIALLQNMTLNFENLRTLDEGSSDHNPILLELGDQDEDMSTFTKKRTDWEQFRASLQRDIAPIPRIESEEEIEAAISTLEEDIHRALRASTTETVTRRVAAPMGELPEDTRQLIRDRRRAKRIAQRTRQPQARLVYNQLSRRVKAALQEHRQARWQRHLESLNPEDRSMWNTQKALRNPRKPMPPIHGEQGIVYTRQQKAEAFADSLELQCRENQLDGEDEDWSDDVERRVRRINRLPDDDEITPTSPEEVKEILRRLKIRKAPGCDNIGNIVLRKLPRKGVAALVNIINAILRFRYFPEKWKRADVIMIPKPGKDLLFPSSYRPISLLPAISKVAERVILERLRTYSEELQVIPDEQFAYRSGHSTELQVLRLTEYVTEGFNHRQVTGAIFLDVAKAFDRVWHAGLLAKMIDMGYPTAIVKLVRSYLNRRELRVRVEGELSTYRPMEAGVPQGSVLSPHLFTIFTADLPRTARTSLALYADDTAIVARSTQARQVTRYLQEAASLLEEWCNRWKVEINADKSKAILFRRVRKQTPTGHVTMNGEAIQWHDTAKYLGVVMDRSLTWKQNTDEVVKKAKRTRALLYPMVGRQSQLNLRNKLTLIRTVIQPQLTYASVAWGYQAATQMKRIQAVENVALRCAVDAPWFVRNADIRRDLEYTPVSEIIQDRAKKLYARAEEHANPLIRQATAYDPEDAPRHKRPKLQILDNG